MGIRDFFPQKKEVHPQDDSSSKKSDWEGINVYNKFKLGKLKIAGDEDGYKELLEKLKRDIEWDESKSSLSIPLKSI